MDTSVWSLALRRDGPASGAHVRELIRAIDADETIITTGLILQELLQGFSGPGARDEILRRFSALPLLVPDRRDHIEAAELRNTCRRGGVQVGTIDALLAQLCIRQELQLLSTDNDFQDIARLSALRLWTASR
ncbi:MAG TPA: PIN domain-containing protein [Caulobacteraceae bacterium]